MPFDPLAISVAVLAIAILGLSKGGFAGIGMMSTPLLSLVVPGPVAAGIILPVLMFQDVLSMYAYRKTTSRWNLAVLMPGGAVGVLAGSVLVAYADRDMFELILGAISMVFGIERVVRHFGKPPAAHMPNAIIGVICGVLGGVTSMIAHAGIPPFQLFVMPQRLHRDVYIGTSVFFFGIVNFIKFPFFLSLGQITWTTLPVSLALYPVAFVSVILGIKLVRRVSTDGFILMANVILIAIGVLLVFRGLMA